MKLINISFLSIKRQKTKKIFLTIALIIGCSTIISLFTFIESQKTKIEKQFDEYGANIVVMPKSDNLSLSYGGVNVSGITTNPEEMKLDEVKKIWSIPNKGNIRSVSPKLLGVVNLKDNKIINAVLIIGVFFEEEKKIKSWWEIEGNYPQGRNEIILGSEAAIKLNARKGEMLKTMDGELKVSGILKETGSQDDQIVFGDYNYVSKLVGKGDIVSLTEVSALCSDCPIDDIISQISTTLPNANVTGIRQIMKQRMETVGQFEKFAVSITIVIILIGAILIFTSMMGAVAEKTHEIGIFRAIGFKKSNISSIILTESFIISAVAGIIGIAVGIIASFFVLPQLTDTGVEMVKLNPLLFILTALGVILLSFAATVYPAYKASNIDPVIALSSL